jgi:hypothetical protein
MFTTPFLFNRFYTTNTGLESISASTLEPLIEVATEYIEDYLDRKMFYQTHYEQHYIPKTNYIMLDQWPIVDIEYVYTNPQRNFDVKLEDGYNSALVNINDTNVVVTINGTDTTTLDLSAYTMETLGTAINNISGISTNMPTEPDVPAEFIYQPVKMFLTSRNCQQPINSYNSCVQWVFEEGTNSTVRLDRILNCYTFTKYTAGYVIPEDNADNTTLDIEGNVPKSLTDICNRLVLLLYTQFNQNGAINSSQLQSESLGDYKYTLRPTDRSAIEDLLFSFDMILDKYRRKNIAF